MSAELLTELQAIRAFDPRVRFDELGYLHVPFDQMHGTDNVETRISSAILRGERFALIGTTGNGKSSTASYVALPTNEAIIAFQIGVTVEDPSLLMNPGHFAQHVVRRIARDAKEVPEPQRLQLELDVADTRVVRAERSRRTTATINAKVVELSRELGNVSASVEHRASAHELIEALDHALELIRSTGAAPVLVIDDSDTWLEVGDKRLHETRQAFFGPVMRMLAERGCGLIVAVDERYLDQPEYRPARDGHLPNEVHIPRLRGPNDLSSLLGHRVAQVDTAHISDAFTETVIEDAFSAYSNVSLSLRVLMRLVHSALYHAVEAGSARIGAEAFAASLREYAAESPSG
jgi:hypothetical protein